MFSESSMGSFPWFITAVGIFVLSSVHGLDLKSFVKDHCSLQQSRRHQVELNCSNFKLSTTDVDYVQKSDFIFTNLTSAHFENCDIGIVNENFYSKLPNVEVLRFDKVNFTTSFATREFSLISPSKIFEFFIIEGSFTHTQCSNFLGSLPELKYFYIGSTLIDFKVMNSTFFQNNYNLNWISIQSVPLSSFEEGTFDNLMNLEYFYASKLNINFLPRNLFSKNTKLKSIRIEECNLIKVPELDYPKSINYLSLRSNNIKTLTTLSFKNLEHVSTLQLANNKIENFWLEVFDEMKNLTSLDLSNNFISDISKDHFWRIDNMTLIDLRLNNIEKTDLEEYNFANVMLYPTKSQNQQMQKIELEKSDLCGCGHVWAILAFTIAIMICSGGFLAWKYSISWKSVFCNKVESFEEDNSNLL